MPHPISPNVKYLAPQEQTLEIWDLSSIAIMIPIATYPLSPKWLRPACIQPNEPTNVLC